MNKWQKYIGTAISGVVKRNDPTIEVYCPELLPGHEGDVTVPTVETTITVIDELRGPQIIRFKNSDTLKCVYHPEGFSQYANVPDIVPGERVYVYWYEGSDIYYWTPCRETSTLRKTEHMKLSIQAKNHSGVDEDALYYFEMDSQNKVVRLHCSSENGEANEIDVIIDTKTGTITLNTKATSFFMDGPKGTIILNAGKSKIEMINDVINLVAKIVSINGKQIMNMQEMIIETPTTFSSRVTFHGGTRGCGGH